MPGQRNYWWRVMGAGGAFRALLFVLSHPCHLLVERYPLLLAIPSLTGLPTVALATGNPSRPILLQRLDFSDDDQEDRWPLHGWTSQGIRLLEEEDLVGLIKSPDQAVRKEALEEIYNRNCDELKMYLRSNQPMFQGLDEEGAKEVFAITWDRAYRKVLGGQYEYTSRKPFIAFLKGIAQLVALEHYREKRRERKLFEAFAQQEHQRGNTLGKDPAKLLEETEEQNDFDDGASIDDHETSSGEDDLTTLRDRKLLAALDSLDLSQRDRSIIILTHFFDQSSNQIASEMGMKANTVRQIRTRVYKSLRKLLA